jgi:ComF family protein
MRLSSLGKRLGRTVVDFALPPRCAGCGLIVDEVGSFCALCWTKIEFLGAGGCERCGIPLEATDAEVCAACLAQPSAVDRMRAAVAYGEIARSLALRLKYGRKTALAATMARFMAVHLNEYPPDSVLMPVPLHRRRLWGRGFNQAVLIAGQLAETKGLRVECRTLVRTKATPPLKAMSMAQRRRAVSGAFAIASGQDVAGRTIILIDDVLTTGSTASACAKVLKRAGAERVELISWARVVRPVHLMR